MNFIIETESGSLYKIEQRGRDWYIFISKLKGWKRIDRVIKGEEELNLAQLRPNQLRGAFFWYNLGDKEKTVANTGITAYVYAQIA